jgi:hypothetical protein
MVLAAHFYLLIILLIDTEFVLSVVCTWIQVK